VSDGGAGAPRGDIMWAPWRMGYVTREHEDGYEGPACVFCRLLSQRDDRQAYILYRGARSFVIMNLYPYNNGHLMIVPNVHVDALTELDAETLAEMGGLAQRAQTVLDDTMRPQGFNMGINQGRAAGAGIADHLHMHVVPRWVGDTNFMPVLSDVRVIPQHMDETYDLLLPGFRS
jgi:ATP adenylyltransferase